MARPLQYTEGLLQITAAAPWPPRELCALCIRHDEALARPYSAPAPVDEVAVVASHDSDVSYSARPRPPRI